MRRVMRRIVIVIKKILMTVKRSQYQTIEFSHEHGCEMPDNANDLVAMVEEIKSNPLREASCGEWVDDEVIISNFNIVESA